MGLRMGSLEEIGGRSTGEGRAATMLRFTIQGFMRVVPFVAVICAAVCDLGVMIGASTILFLAAAWLTFLDPRRHAGLPTAPRRSNRSHEGRGLSRNDRA